MCACASLHAKHRISTFSTIFLISYVIWRHKFKACIFKKTVWCIHFSVLSHIIIYLGLIACGCINRCSHLPVSIARKGKIFLFFNACVTQRRKGTFWKLPSLYPPSHMCQGLPSLFSLFGKCSCFQESSYATNAMHMVPTCFADKGLLQIKGHFVISSVGGEKEEENPGKLLCKIKNWGGSGGGVFIRYSESIREILLGVWHLCQIVG